MIFKKKFGEMKTSLYLRSKVKPFNIIYIMTKKSVKHLKLQKLCEDIERVVREITLESPEEVSEFRVDLMVLRKDVPVYKILMTAYFESVVKKS